MKQIFSTLLLVLALSPAVLQAQTFPAVPAAPPSNLQGQALRDWLRTNWYDGKRTVLSYSAARAKMYNYADNYNNSVTCVYSGYNTPNPFSFTSSSTTSAANINCEHTIPQSWFNEASRMVSDMHHLYPTYIQWNSNRGNDPFADIPDATTTLWMRNTSSQTTIPTSNIDEYSEDTNSQFEPREDHKGNVARTAFYFYTMHDTQPELIANGKQNISSLAPLATLYAWHLADPVDAHEIERNKRVAASQGNYNPYIEHPELVALAYGLAPAGPTFSFAAGTGTIAEGNAGTSTYTFTVNLSPAATTASTVQVSLNTASSTATGGTDFTFASPATVTFPAGSTSQTVTLTVTGDTQPEADETVVLNLTNPSTGNSVGSPAAHTLTITNDDGPAPTVAFATATGSLAEGNTGTSTYTVNVTATGTLPTGTFTVPVSVDATNSTATPTTDYTLNTTSLTFSATATTQPITITVVGDAVYEPNETVRLLLGTPSNGSIIVGSPNAHVFTITNDDAAPAGAPCTKLYFSQYTESSTLNTKVLEIYNPTASPVSLNGKRLALYSNGATTVTTPQALSGTIAPYDVYVVANTGVTDAGVKAQTDLESAVAFFNGDDAIALFDGTDTLDVIGVIGQRPTEWTVAGNGSTLNNTMVRLPNTSQGGRWNGPYGAATWTGNGVDNYAGVGSYTSTACGLATATRAAAVLRNTLEIFPNPATETVQVRLPGLATARATTVQVLDMLGRPVRQRTAQLGGAETVAVDLRGLPAGIYAVRVQTAEADYTGRVVVR
ncbi:endonuclease [Hymenobacter sp. DH14]|uniref:Endonuclease n=1 Tax=Hymenobacter cyanobacteriorum TaxID=2926463 RepID=A0A9X1VF37_9BACT|nr:endonuclease [Hymenobacter cyanobacteriorum]MCI1186918.1 endonuclease [Hymenobacter cyanobacteriorum]